MSLHEITYTIRGRIVTEADSEEEAVNNFFNPDTTSNEDLLAGANRQMEDIGNAALEILDITKRAPKKFAVHASIPLMVRVGAHTAEEAEEQVSALLNKGLTLAEIRTYTNGHMEIGTVEEEE